MSLILATLWKLRILLAIMTVFAFTIWLFERKDRDTIEGSGGNCVCEEKSPYLYTWRWKQGRRTTWSWARCDECKRLLSAVDLAGLLQTLDTGRGTVTFETQEGSREVSAALGEVEKTVLKPPCPNPIPVHKQGLKFCGFCSDLTHSHPDEPLVCRGCQRYYVNPVPSQETCRCPVEEIVCREPGVCYKCGKPLGGSFGMLFQ